MAIDYGLSGDNRFTPSSSLLDNPFDGGGTWAFWFKHAVESSGALQYIVDKGGISLRFQQHSGGNNRINLNVGFSTTNGLWFTPFPADLPQGVWNHFSVRYNADAVANNPRFTLNGADEGFEEAVAPVGTRTANTSNPQIGGTGASSGVHIQEDMRFYSRELSDEEILTIANVRGVDGVVDGLIARWMQDEGAEGITVPTTSGFVKDRGPDKINGTIQVSNPVYEAGELRSRKMVL